MGQTESKEIHTPLFLVGSEAINALEEAEASDGYLSAVNSSSINRRARANNSYSVSPDSVIHSLLENHTSLPTGVVVTLMPSADAGFPHTRGNDIICLPAYYPSDRLASVLVHERVHLHQKQNRKKYIEFYKSKWGFEEYKDEIPDSIAKRIRINPDTLGWPIFIWKDKWIPLCLFEREDKPNLRECTYCWYNPKGGVLLKSMPPAWREFFGNVGQSEHPNELAACYVAEYNLYKNVDAAKQIYAFLFVSEK